MGSGTQNTEPDPARHCVRIDELQKALHEIFAQKANKPVLVFSEPDLRATVTRAIKAFTGITANGREYMHCTEANVSQLKNGLVMGALKKIVDMDEDLSRGHDIQFDDC